MLLNPPIAKLKRFRRADPERGEALPPFDLQERDREILKLIFELRVATAEILQHLVTPLPLSERYRTALEKAHAGYQTWLAHEQAAGRRAQRGATTVVKREMHNRLYKLYHHGYVKRLKISNNQPIVYHLGLNAIPELVSSYGIDYNKARDQTRDDKLHTDSGDEPGHFFAKHALMLGRFRASMAQAFCNNHEATFAFWEPDGALHETVSCMNEAGKREGLPMIPDAHVGIYDGTEMHHLFLEVERTLKTPARFYRKLYAYKEFFEQVLHKQYQMEHFRVLTIAPTDAMAHLLRSIASRIPSSRGLFWFTSEQRYRDNPANLLAPIWQTAKNDDWRALLEPPKSSQGIETRPTTPARASYMGRSAL
jgi:hypothetical protein